MSLRIEDYALIGDCRTAALVGLDGSIDWLCLPRFDSGACFASLLGTPEHGRWLIAPAAEAGQVQVRRRYRPGTLVLETEFATERGRVLLTDAMPLARDDPRIVRRVEGKSGKVPMRFELVVRFDYGAIVPWVQRRDDGGISAIAGPDKLRLWTEVEVRGENLTTVAEFTVEAGQSVSFDLAWHPSIAEPPGAIDVARAIEETALWWSDWSSRCTFQDGYTEREAVVRSLITLKALTYAPTGGIVAAATTSLPEALGGVRNWDYRYCWLRDATFTLYSLMIAGYLDEARDWREWLLRSIADTPPSLQIMYGLAGERRLTELELPWLPGYEGSKPVRIGNGASSQFQLDVYDEVLDVFHQARRLGLATHEDGWRNAKSVLGFLETAWHEPDEGIWEVRGGRRHFTHSKVMAWVAFDRMVKAVEQFPLDGPVERWRAQRDAIHAEVCRHGFSANRNAFVQSYGVDELDASLLMIPLVGFLPPDDPRVLGTVAAIEKHLMVDGFVTRYATRSNVDGLPPGEGVFLPCTFWFADNLALQGRLAEARRLFDRLLAIRNDVGLLAEEYDTKAGRQLGNFPQAFSHVSLINTAHNLLREAGPAELRPQT
jgi:GH15 family glucan-1,4-alpha-glucosidase